MVFEELPIVATETTVRWGALPASCAIQAFHGVLHTWEHAQDGWQALKRRASVSARRRAGDARGLPDDQEGLPRPHEDGRQEEGRRRLF